MDGNISTFKMDKLRRKLAALERHAELSQEEVVGNLAGVFVGFVTDLTPRDTNRLVRGWIFAGNMAGVTDLPLPPLNKSPRHDKYIKKLLKEIEEITTEIDKFAGWMKKYEDDDIRNTFRRKSNGRKYKKRTSQKFYRKIKRLRAKFEKRRIKMERNYEAARDNIGILFFDKSGGSKRRRSKKRKFSSVRVAEYLGTGEVINDGQRVVIRLVNHEPHGRFVENNWRLGHPMATAIALTKSLGMKWVSRKYAQDVRRVAKAA